MMQVYYTSHIRLTGEMTTNDNPTVFLCVLCVLCGQMFFPG